MSACIKSPAPYGLSDKYWDSLSAEHQALFRVIRPMPAAPYTVDWGLGDLEDALSRIEADPDLRSANPVVHGREDVK